MTSIFMSRTPYEMVTGRKPFEAETPVQLYALQRFGALAKPMELRHGLAPKAQQAILKALAFSPEERHKRARDFGNELAQALRTTDSSKEREPNIGTMVSKMCNRRSQEDDFKGFLLRNMSDSAVRAQMCILHGGEGECHESMVERLAYALERLGLYRTAEDRPIARVKKIPWQYEGDLESRKRRLFSWLFEQLGSMRDAPVTDVSPVALAKLLSSTLTSFVVLQHDIRASRWDETTGALIRAYREYLAASPLDSSMPRLIVFLNVVYPPVVGYRPKIFLQKLARKRIQQELTGIARVAGPTGCPAAILDELMPVTREDVLEWFSLHNIGDSEEQRLKSSEKIFPAAQPVRRRMAEVEACLRELHQSYIHDRGYA